MRCPAAGKLPLRPCRRELLHDARPFAGHPPHLLNRSLKALELPLQILDGGLNPIAERAPAIRKEEIAGGGPDDCSEERSCRHCRSIVHTRPPEPWQLQDGCHDSEGLLRPKG